jgi:hypothetical protein
MPISLPIAKEEPQQAMEKGHPTRKQSFAKSPCVLTLRSLRQSLESG